MKKNNFSETGEIVEDIDLSRVSRKRRMSNDEIEKAIKADEAKVLIDGVFSDLSLGSPLNSSIKIPDRVANLLNSYGSVNESKYYGLIKLTLDIAMSQLYDEAYRNVFAELVNNYFKRKNLKFNTKWHTDVKRESMARHYLNNVISSFESFPEFLDDINIRTSGYLKELKNAINLDGQIINLQREIGEIERKHAKEIAELRKTNKEHIAELSNSISSLKSKLQESMETKESQTKALNKLRQEKKEYYHIPKPMTLLKRLKQKLKGVVKK